MSDINFNDTTTRAVVGGGGSESGTSTGESIIHTLPSIPSGFLLANGAAVSRTTYSALFAAIGDRFGIGDGSTTFNLPSLPTNLAGGNFNSTDLPAARYGHTVTKLADGRLLVIGGYNAGAQDSVYFGVINNGTITWTSGTALPAARYIHTTTLLNDNRILVIAGANSGDTAVKNTYFGVISGDSITWTNGTDITTTMYEHSATLLADDRILVIGGVNSAAAYTNLTYFGTISGDSITWAAGTVYPITIAAHTTTLFPDGRILVTAGSSEAVDQTATNFGVISTNSITWTGGTAFPSAVSTHATVLLPDGRVLVLGGTGPRSTCYFGAITSNTVFWSQTNNMLTTRRLMGSAATIINESNRLIVVGGLSAAVSALVEVIPLEVKIIKT